MYILKRIGHPPVLGGVDESPSGGDNDSTLTKKLFVPYNSDFPEDGIVLRESLWLSKRGTRQIGFDVVAA